MKIADTEKDLTPEQIAVAGNNPVYDFNAILTFSGGNNEKVSNFSEALEIKIPYEAKSGENPEMITVFFINDKGELNNKAGRYDAAAKTITFKTNHFSKYMIVNNSVRFEDIADGFWGRPSIEALASKGIINGKSGKNYKPNDYVTRAEFAKMLTTTFGLVDGKASASFTDADKSSWYYTYVASAVKTGIIEGYKDGTFKGDKAVSREDMAVMAARVLKFAKADNTNQILNFRDKSDISGYALEAVVNCTRYGIITGKPNNMMDPKGTATRAEAAAVIYRLYNY